MAEYSNFLLLLKSFPSSHQHYKTNRLPNINRYGMSVKKIMPSVAGTMLRKYFAKSPVYWYVATSLGCLFTSACLLEQKILELLYVSFCSFTIKP